MAKGKKRRLTASEKCTHDSKRAKVAGDAGDNGSSFTTAQGQVLPAKLKKYWAQRMGYFWRFDQGIQIDEEGWYSVTPEAIADSTAERIAQLYNDKQAEKGYGRLCVVDAFCGVGGNAIKFAEWCEHVIAIDIDPVRLEMARNNARVYGVDDRIEFILGDFYHLAPQIKADAVFLSPPWGGPDYIGADVFGLDQLPIHTGKEWLERARLISSNVIYYLPKNCDPAELANLCPDVSCDIEMNVLNGALKAITVYYDQLALFGSSNPRCYRNSCR
ncbi:Trimethylguanosine synthase [Dipsacomyces acuminosporus]|nr:Trimethylguanosine synthase [Dipsacomyces acuminosporus]